MSFAAIAPIIAAMIPMITQAAGKKGGLFGSDEKHGSTYGKPGLGLINDIIGQVKGGLGNQDITQNQGYGQGQEWLNDLFNDPGFFQRFEAPARRQFEENTIPDLANRFASMGTGGSTGSTGFRNQAVREGSNLEANLASMRGGMQQQGVGQQLGYAQQPISNWQQLLQNALTPTQNTFQGPSQGLFGGMLPGLFSGAAQGFGNMWGQNMAGNGQQQPQQQQSFPGQSPLTRTY